MSNTSCIELVSILILGNLNISCQSDLIYLNKETNLAVRFIGTLLPTVADRSGSLTVGPCPESESWGEKHPDLDRTVRNAMVDYAKLVHGEYFYFPSHSELTCFHRE